METLNKILELFQNLEYRIGFVLMLIIPFIFSGILNLSRSKSSERFLYLINNNKKTLFYLLVSFWLIIFSTLFLLSWLLNISKFSSIENYFISLILMMIFSSSFGWIAFLINSFNNHAYDIQGIERELQFDKEELQIKIEKIEKSKSLLEEFINELSENSFEIEFLGKLPELSLGKVISDFILSKKIEPDFKRSVVFSSSIVYSIINSDYFIVHIIFTNSSPFGGTNAYHTYLTKKSSYAEIINNTDFIKYKRDDESYLLDEENLKENLKEQIKRLDNKIFAMNDLGSKKTTLIRHFYMLTLLSFLD